MREVYCFHDTKISHFTILSLFLLFCSNDMAATLHIFLALSDVSISRMTASHVTAKPVT